jgi:hypothetical protein
MSKKSKFKDRMKYFNEGKRTAVSEVVEWIAFNIPFSERGMDIKEEMKKTKDSKLKRDLRIRYDEINVIAGMTWKLLQDEKFLKRIAHDIVRDSEMGEEQLE